jgi:hypothetical protein
MRLICRRRVSRYLLILAGVAVSSLLVGSLIAQAKEDAAGEFVGRLVTEWLDDGRNMKLIKSFGYQSSDKTVWKVPRGTVVNGASIPQFLWSFIGSPFGDKYRKASVVHDYYCESRSRSWKRVHQIFYEAMLTSGVDSSRAWLMYQAVLRFGPRWKLNSNKSNCKRVNGKIDFTSCTRNSVSEKPRLVIPKSDPASIQKFLNEMKQGQHAEAAEQLEASLNRAN